jgi:hypothetical protein
VEQLANPPRKNAEETRGRPFRERNPGRPKGAQNSTIRLVEALLDQGRIVQEATPTAIYCRRTACSSVGLLAVRR